MAIPTRSGEGAELAGAVSPLTRPESFPSCQEAEATLRQLASAFPHHGKGSDLTLLLATAAAVPTPEARLREAEARYRALVEQIPAVTFMAPLDGSTGELYVSPQIERLLGFSAREWLDDPVLWYRQLHPDDKDRWQAEFAATCNAAHHFRSEYRFLAKDGRTVWVHGEALVVSDSDGRPLFLQGVAFDITDIKLAEQELRHLNAELTRARDQALDGNEGVSVARTASPDLILMDMSMPVLNGWDATRLLKADPLTRTIPVIGLSAHAMMGDREKALAAGCDDYDTKPVDWPRLLAKIQAILSKKVLA